MTRVRTRLLPFNKPQVPGLWYGVFSVLVGLASLVEQADAVRNSPAQTWTRTKEIASGSHTLEFNPFETIAAYQDEFTKLYNQKNFTELAGMYCGHSLTLKKDPSKFYNSTELPGLFEEIYTSGLKEIDTAPAVIFQESKTVIHEIGQSFYFRSPYYIRWIFCEKMLTWKIDVHVLDLAVQGGDSGSSRAVQVEEAHQGEESDLMSVITKLDQEYSDLYNSRQFKDIGKLYEEGAVFLPNEIGNGFIVGTDDIADYLATIYYVKDGLHEIHLKPVHLITDPGSEDVVHEIGQVTFTPPDGSPTQASYYCRWTRDATSSNQDDWLISLELDPVA